MSILTIILFLIFTIFAIWVSHVHNGYVIARDYFNKSEVIEAINKINEKNIDYSSKLELFGDTVFEPLITVVMVQYMNYNVFWYRYSAVSIPIIWIGSKVCAKFKS